jgi:hypothetical protein
MIRDAEQFCDGISITARESLSPEGRNTGDTAIEGEEEAHEPEETEVGHDQPMGKASVATDAAPLDSGSMIYDEQARPRLSFMMSIGSMGESGAISDERVPVTLTLTDIRRNCLSAKLTYGSYIMERDRQQRQPSTAFFFGAADALYAGDLREAAVLALGSATETQLDDDEVLRAVGYKLTEFDEDSTGVFEKVLEKRPEQPQSFRDLALVLAKRNKPGDRKRAAELLECVKQEPWGLQHNQIETIAATDLQWLNFLATKREEEESGDSNIETFTDGMPLDLRVVCTWNTTQTDVELIVTDPTGETCHSFHNLTRIGGLISRDFTHGLGPVEFSLRRAIPGKYTISVRLFSSIRSRRDPPTVACVSIWTRFC